MEIVLQLKMYKVLNFGAKDCKLIEKYLMSSLSYDKQVLRDIIYKQRFFFLDI